jgi:predicted RND superfamily exporter protein
MLNTAFSAAGIALGCSAAVILFSSQSIILMIFSTLTIGFVLTAVTSMLVSIGWTLGFLESICFAILIGVSVDFVIHFSHAYAHKHGEISRGDRTKYAVVKMGPSILATAFTTILSAVVMLFTVITFFQKFALILFFAIIQATLGSFIFFLTLVDCIGPTNPRYLVDAMLKWNIWRCKKNGSSYSDNIDDHDSKRDVGTNSTTLNVTSRSHRDSSSSGSG